jgi:hypothetical protein
MGSYAVVRHLIRRNGAITLALPKTGLNGSLGRPTPTNASLWQSHSALRPRIAQFGFAESPTIQKSSVPLFDREHCIGKCTRFFLRKIVPGIWDDSVFMAAREL